MVSSRVPPGMDVVSCESRVLPSVEKLFLPRLETTRTPGATVLPVDRMVVADRSAAAVKDGDIPKVLRLLAKRGVFSATDVGVGEEEALKSLEESEEVAMVFDLDALRASLASAQEAFPKTWTHCFAVKTCPLSFVVQEVLRAGFGIEGASFVELYMALAHGCDPSTLLFDSPAKTQAELSLALKRGILINANSVDELYRIKAIIEAGKRESIEGSGVGGCNDPAHGGLEGRCLRRGGTFHRARVGIRLNPLNGSGAIEELSVSTVNSKFGVPATAENRRLIMELFATCPWLVGLHTHVGSQGCTLDQLAEGGALLCDIADAIDEALGPGRVEVLDIGGGLPANYTSGDVRPSFADYAAVLKERAPGLFEPERPWKVVTEFGRSLVAKCAFTASSVEYVRKNNCLVQSNGACVGDGGEEDGSSGKNQGLGHEGMAAEVVGGQTLVTHMGSDLFLRECYCPGKFPHRISVFGQTGESLPGPAVPTDVAGPLCFGGDYLARSVGLPMAHAGDLAVIHDTGSNSISLFSRHCSRQAPAVYGYTRAMGDGALTVCQLKPKENVRDVAKFWGARCVCVCVSRWYIHFGFDFRRPDLFFPVGF
ncbi:unnamed protein product [Discosporangium mesarthrocarpum]